MKVRDLIRYQILRNPLIMKDALHAFSFIMCSDIVNYKWSESGEIEFRDPIKKADISLEDAVVEFVDECFKYYPASEPQIVGDYTKSAILGIRKIFEHEEHQMHFIDNVHNKTVNKITVLDDSLLNTKIPDEIEEHTFRYIQVLLKYMDENPNFVQSPVYWVKNLIDKFSYYELNEKKHVYVNQLFSK